MMKCKICSKEIKIKGFGSHLKHTHNISTKEYYDKYLKKPEEGICPICGKETNFSRLSLGYQKHCSCMCSNNNSTTQKKSKETKLERYDNENYNNREQSKQTCLKKYGVEHNWSSKDPKLNGRTTKLEKYGSETYNNIAKREQTVLKKYGVKHPMQSNEVKSKFDYTTIVDKLNKTKKKNNTFNVSSQEELAYKLLLECFSEVERQYIDKRYPFQCDFYLPEKDIFIECNFHWTHGGHWFNYNNVDDRKKLSKWKEKARTSKFYANAITTWIKRDIEKRNYAIKNNLKYKVFWNLEELKIWMKGENYDTVELQLASQKR